MFERFTDRARRVVVLAQEEARMLNHNYIGTEHILLGLIHEGEGVAAKALERLRISLDGVREQVEGIIGRGRQMPSGHIPFTPRAKKVLELSLRAALELGHNYIGTEHILLGLIKEGEGVAAQVLVRMGADLPRVREQVIDLLHGYKGTEPSSPPAAPPAPPGTPLERWASAHARTVRRDGVPAGRSAQSDPDLRAALAGLPLLAVAGIVVPLALLLDLVRLTGGSPPADPRLQALTSQAGVSRIRSLAWPPAARVGVVALLIADLPPDPSHALPASEEDGQRRPRAVRELDERIAQVRVDKEREIDRQDFEKAAAFRDTEKQLLGHKDALERAWRSGELPAEDDGVVGAALPALHAFRDALLAALASWQASEPRRVPGAVRELDERIAEARREKEAELDRQDFEKAAAHRMVEKGLIEQKDALERAWKAGEVEAGEETEEEAEPAWQASGEVVEAVGAAIAAVTARTIGMLEILGPVATAAEPTLPLKVRHRIYALPKIGTRERRLLLESVAISTTRTDVTAAAPGATSGTSGISRRGKITGLLPAQLALPEDLLEFRFANRELLYRVNEADVQSPPEAVTIVLDTTPATYGPAELVLRLVAHVLAVTLWTVGKPPALVSLDQPRLIRQLAAPADLAMLWTVRTLEPPDVRAGLATARHLGTSAILLTEHHLVQDLPVVPHAGLRVLTTHVADDPPAHRIGGSFHVHLPPDPTCGQIVSAVHDLLQPASGRKAS